MRIINAFWEQRNLGVGATEFDVALNDGADIIADVLANERQYNVMRVPAGNTVVLYAAQEQGYTFAESMVSVCITRNEFENLALPAPQMRMVNALSYTPMSQSDIDVLFSEIKGGIFKNDRISRDPHFGEKFAAQRYIGYVTDTLASGAKAFNIVYKEQNIGFFINKKKDNNEVFGELFGMFPDWKKSGLGLAGNYLSIKQGFDDGATRALGSGSSNNIDQLRLSFVTGMCVTEMKYILVKFNNGNEKAFK